MSHGRLAASTEARGPVYPAVPDRFLVPSSPAFDSSIVGLFWTLRHGGTVVLPGEDQVHDIPALVELMAGGISHTLMVPTLYQALLDHGAGAAHWPDHVIVAGWGQVGESIVNSLYEAGEQVVIVDRSQDIPEDHYRVVGDATEDDVLREAGIERAKALIVALNSDADAVYVTLSARSFSNDLHIIARANSPEAESKLHRAGASSVVNPAGRRNAIRPSLVSSSPARASKTRCVAKSSRRPTSASAQSAITARSRGRFRRR